MQGCPPANSNAGRPPAPKPGDKAARREDTQIQHTPKLTPAPAHKSFCKFPRPTSRCASTPSYTLCPSQASPLSHPPPSLLTLAHRPQHVCVMRNDLGVLAKHYHLFPSLSQAIIQSGLLQKGENLHPTAQLLTAKPDPTGHPAPTARSHQEGKIPSSSLRLDRSFKGSSFVAVMNPHLKPQAKKKRQPIR